MCSQPVYMVYVAVQGVCANDFREFTAREIMGVDCIIIHACESHSYICLNAREESKSTNMGNDNITTTKQITTQMSAFSMGYTVDSIDIHCNLPVFGFLISISQ